MALKFKQITCCIESRMVTSETDTDTVIGEIHLYALEENGQVYYYVRPLAEVFGGEPDAQPYWTCLTGEER